MELVEWSSEKEALINQLKCFQERRKFIKENYHKMSPEEKEALKKYFNIVYTENSK